ncbi:MAG TPA: TIGR03862 family flavoprotein [Pseudomonadales bacterium]
MAQALARRQAAVIGAGPAGLMAAEQLAHAGLAVHVYDRMPSAGRKLLMAGVGGLNITHNEDWPQFVRRHGDAADTLLPILQQLPPAALRDWLQQLGIDTFVGSSGRVFPAEMKAAPLLRRWLQRLRAGGVQFFMRHRWLGRNDNGHWLFESRGATFSRRYDVVVLALGGGSWPQLGSDGSWQAILQQAGIAMTPLQPANSGFCSHWSDFLQQRHAGAPLKNVVLSFTSHDGRHWQQHGECVISHYGLEGSAIYALSAPLRDTIAANGEFELLLDLAPQRNEQQLRQALHDSRKGDSTSNRLRKKAGLSAAAIALLQDNWPAQLPRTADSLAARIKRLPIRLSGSQPLAEAISSAGGVAFAALDQQLMLNAWPGVFCAGEMLDWEAPTGGYLLTACMASGKVAGMAAAAWHHAPAASS